MNGTATVLPGKVTLGKQTSKTKKNSKANKALFLSRQTLIKMDVGFLVLIIVLGSGIGYAQAYSDKIYPKITIADIKVGGMTVDEAKSSLKEKVQELNEQGTTIIYNATNTRADQTFKPKLDEMGISYDVDGTIAEAFEYGRGGNVFSRLKDNLELTVINQQIDLEPQIDEEKFNQYLDGVAKKVEILARDKRVQDGTNQILDEGQDGLEIEKEALSDQIREIVVLGTASASIELPIKVVEKKTVTIYPHAQPGRYPGRYIDINLSEQTLYAFEGSTLVNQFLISSGRSGYATPTGEYSVWDKTRSQLMDGPDYYLPNVPWISWFNGEISIHGTYWHNNFGTPMSHGCINASIPDAEWVYNWDEVGTPVYVHYSEN